LSEDLDTCTICKNGNLRASGQVLIEGQSVGDYREIGSRRVYVCHNCGRKQIRVGVHQYVAIGNDVKTRPDDRLSQPEER
jgi:hypothetical protein